ncbi:MAG TPA: hypothetical protein VMW91_09130 [Desulfosporosinus sp.]|nr:hypothetical protein [Desulfosporosinus sp.]
MTNYKIKDESIFQGWLRFRVGNGEFRAERSGDGIVSVFVRQGESFGFDRRVRAKFTANAVYTAWRDSA